MRLKRLHGTILGICLVVLTSVGGLTVLLSGDGLRPIERECRDALLKHPRMAGLSDFRIKEHYDWWERRYEMSWGLGGAVSEPYKNPQVDLVVRFKIGDGPLQSAWARCRYTIVPNSGHPPRVRFDNVRLL